jgi:hypothetical protein
MALPKIFVAFAIFVSFVVKEGSFVYIRNTPNFAGGIGAL